MFFRIIKKLFSGLVGSLPGVSDGIPTSTVAVENYDPELAIAENSEDGLTMYQKLSIWATAPAYFDIKITDATKVLEITNIINNSFK